MGVLQRGGVTYPSLRKHRCPVLCWRERKRLTPCLRNSCVVVRTVSNDYSVSGEFSYVFVRCQTVDGSQQIHVMRPGGGAVEDIDRSMLNFLRLHDLDAEEPHRIVSLLNRIEEVLDVVICFRARQSFSGLAVHCFDTTFWLEMPLDVNTTFVPMRLVVADDIFILRGTNLFV
jgi:hypothetical protein